MKDQPQIESIAPQAAIAGGEILIRGRGFQKNGASRPTVPLRGSRRENRHQFGKADSGPRAGRGRREHGKSGNLECPESPCRARPRPSNWRIISIPSPAPPSTPKAMFLSLSAVRAAKKPPVSVYKISTEREVRPFLTEMMNPTGISFDRAGQMYVSSRFEGNVYQVSPSGERSVYADGMGVATGIAFDEDENLYVGDRSGTVFKIDRKRKIFVFATLEPSMAAYHLAFGPSGYLYLSSPTTSSFDFVFRISPEGGGFGILSRAGASPGVWPSTGRTTSTWPHHSVAGAESSESPRT